MKNPLKNKILAILIIIIASFIFFYSNVYAFSINDLTGSSISNQQLTNAGNSLITILTTIGIVVSVVTLIILGLKYMLGSVEEKATYKKTMMPYLIGATLVFAASAIAGMIYSFSINIGK